MDTTNILEQEESRAFEGLNSIWPVVDLTQRYVFESGFWAAISFLSDKSGDEIHDLIVNASRIKDG